MAFGFGADSSTEETVDCVETGDGSDEDGVRDLVVDDDRRFAACSIHSSISD